MRGAKILSQLSRHYWWPKIRADIEKWCRGCLVCATRHIGQKVISPLTPIPVGGPFDRVGVNVVQLPKTRSGKRHAVVFIDYLTKWPEVFATSNQSAYTIAKLLVEKIVSRHGVPSQLLSDRGGAFLSKLLQEIGMLLGFHKVNTTAYHPQTDDLVERFNRTLIDMLAKTAEQNGKNWDEKLPFVLFAYRSTAQESTGESAQLHQKRQHDKSVRHNKFSEGDSVFLYDPSLKTGKAYKFAKPFRGPYKIVHLVRGGAEIQLHVVAKPKSKLIRVAFHRLRRCPKEISDINNGLEPVQKQAVEESEKLDGTFNVANGLSTVNDDSVVKKQTADNLVSEDSATDVPVEECTTDVPMEDSATDVPVEDSIIDIPKKDLATSTREEQSTAERKAKASDKAGCKWKDRLRPRRKKEGCQGTCSLRTGTCNTLFILIKLRM